MAIAAKKILAIKLRKLSELVVWTGALRSLRHAYPDAQIDILVNENMSHVFKEFPLIQNIHLVPKTGRFALLKTLMRLRREHYDLALAFDATPKLARLVRFAGAKEVCAHDHSRKKKPFFSHLSVDNPGEMADNLHLDSKVLLSLGILERIANPKMFISDRTRRQAFERLNFQYDQASSRSKVALLPGASIETKAYPRDLWLRTLDTLIDNKRYVVGVFADKAFSQRWDLRAECFRRGVRLYDDLSLTDLLAYLSWFDVAVCNDSASLHLAASMDVRTLTLFGPGNIGREHGYSRDGNLALRVGVDCRPEGPRDNERFQYCNLTQCSHLRCLRSIEPEHVAQGVRTLLNTMGGVQQQAR
jgi:ADP-heptose:LPS heptosyltransferase